MTVHALVYIANLSSIDAARIGYALALDGTVHSALGFTAEWGVEPTIVVTFGTIERDRLRAYLQEIFTEAPEEQALYVIVDGVGEPVYRLRIDGVTSNLPDFK